MNTTNINNLTTINNQSTEVNSTATPLAGTAVLNVSRTDQQLETGATTSIPRTWADLSSLFSQHENQTPATNLAPSASAQTATEQTSPNRRAYSANFEPQETKQSENGKPAVRRRVRRAAGDGETKCEANTIFIGEKDGKNTCAKLDDAYHGRGALTSLDEAIREKFFEKNMFKEGFNQINDTETSKLGFEVLKRLLDGANNTYQQDLKFEIRDRITTQFNKTASANDTELNWDSPIFKDLMRWLELDVKEFANFSMFYNPSKIKDPDVPDNNHPNKKYDPKDMRTGFGAWVSNQSPWYYLKDKSLGEVLLYGAAIGSSLVGSILLIVLLVGCCRRFSQLEQMQHQQNREEFASKKRQKTEEENQRAEDQRRNAAIAREVGPLAAFNDMRFVDHRNYFSDRTLGIPGLRQQQREDIETRAQIVYRQIHPEIAEQDLPAGATGGQEGESEQTPLIDPVTGIPLTNPDEFDLDAAIDASEKIIPKSDSTKPWTMRYLVSDAAIGAKLDVPPPAYDTMDYSSLPVAVPTQANFAYDLASTREHVANLQAELIATNQEISRLETKKAKQNGKLTPKENRVLRELQTCSKKLLVEIEEAKERVKKQEMKQLEQNYEDRVKGLEVFKEAPQTVLPKVAFMPAETEEEAQADLNELAHRQEMIDLPSYHEATHLGHRTQRSLIETKGAVNAIGAAAKVRSLEIKHFLMLQRADEYEKEALALLASMNDEKAESEPKKSAEAEQAEKTQATESEESVAIAIDPDQELNQEPSQAQDTQNTEQTKASSSSSSAITEPSAIIGGARAKTRYFPFGSKSKVDSDSAKSSKEELDLKEEAKRLAAATLGTAQRDIKKGIELALPKLIVGSVQQTALASAKQSNLQAEFTALLTNTLDSAFDLGGMSEERTVDFVLDLVNRIENVMTAGWQTRMQQAIANAVNSEFNAASASLHATDLAGQAEARMDAERDYLEEERNQKKLNKAIADACATVFTERLEEGITDPLIEEIVKIITRSMRNSLTLGQTRAAFEAKVTELEEETKTKTRQQISNDYYEKMASLRKLVRVKARELVSLSDTHAEIANEMHLTALEQVDTRLAELQRSVLANDEQIQASRERKIQLESYSAGVYSLEPISENLPSANLENSELERQLLELEHQILKTVGEQSKLEHEKLEIKLNTAINILVKDIELKAEIEKRDREKAIRKTERENATAIALTIEEDNKEQVEEKWSRSRHLANRQANAKRNLEARLKLASITETSKPEDIEEISLLEVRRTSSSSIRFTPQDDLKEDEDDKIKKDQK